VLATSASNKDAEYFTKALDADDVIDHLTTSDDAEESKPAADIVEAAVNGASLDPQRCIFVGDTVWDVQAAERAGMPCVAVLSGGIDATTLRDAGAVAVYDDVASLLSDFERSPLAGIGNDA
jgi:phosphoglycolate phosphatase-like HAD superfamily hydrolase